MSTECEGRIDGIHVVIKAVYRDPSVAIVERGDQRRGRMQRIRDTAAVPARVQILRGATDGERERRLTLQRGLTFTLTTPIGAIDLLGEIVGGGNYDDLVRDCETFTLAGRRYAVCRCAG